MTSSWFERAVRAEGVAEDLRHLVPELAGGSRQLVGCEMIRLRAAEPEGYWTATYLLDVTDAAGDVDTIAAHGTLIPLDGPAPHIDGDITTTVAFGADGWRCWLAEDRLLLETWSADEALPAMAALSEPASARAVLEDVLRASSADRRELVVVGCTVTVASYKPGVRVTMVCDLDYGRPDPPASWPATVIAKGERPGEGSSVDDAQRALWGSPLARSAAVRIAEPLGHVDELGLSVQGYLDHDRTLKELLAAAFGGGDEDPTESVRATATALAAVHSSGVAHGDIHSWDDELASQLKKHDKLAAAVPWLAEHTAGVPERLAAAGGAAAADPTGASHGSFRTAQVLLGAGPIAIIDFDKLRQAEPAADIGPFLAKLRHTAVNKGGDELPDEATAAAIGRRVDDLRGEFLDAYRAHGSVSPSRLACWEGLEYLSLVLGSAKKGLPERAASCAAMLHHHLDACSL